MKAKKTLALLMLGTMLASLLAACGSSASSSAAAASAGSASAAQPSGTVRILASVTGGKDDEEMKLFEQALGEATGLTISIEKPPSDYDTVMPQKLTAGEEYDLIQMNATQYLAFVNQGILMDITDRVAASEILSNNVPEREWEDITIDGKVYAGFNKIELHRVVALNKNMLEAAGIDYKAIEPTLDGYYEVFKKLKEANSDPDFYPFNAVLSETYDLQPWFASLGLKNGVVTDSDGQRYSPYATEEATEVWEWFKKLYDEKLLDPASFVDKTKDLREKMGAASQKTAVTVDWAMWVGLHNANAEAGGVSTDDYEVVSLPGTETPSGSYMLVKGGASLFAVPINAKNPDGALKVLEYFATQEGGDLLSMGIEGHDYNVENGEVVLTEIGAQHAKDHGAPIPIDKDWEARAGLNLGVEEGLSYLEYATIDQIIPNEKGWKETTGKWAIQIINGQLGTAEALQKMTEELIAMDIVDK